MRYHVKWEMDVEAETPRDAAWYAYSVSAAFKVEEHQTT